MNSKSPDAFRTISEVAEWLDTPAHVLRFWESKFTQVKPVKRAGGRRYYRPADMELIGGIKKLLHDEGMTIKGVQKILREQGVRYVAGLSAPIDGTVLDAEPERQPEATVLPFGRPEAVQPDTAQTPPAADADDLPSFLRGAPPRPVPEPAEVVWKEPDPAAAEASQGDAADHVATDPATDADDAPSGNDAPGATEPPPSVEEPGPAPPHDASPAPEPPAADTPAPVLEQDTGAPEHPGPGQHDHALPDTALTVAKLPRVLDLPPDPADDDPSITAPAGLLSRLADLDRLPPSATAALAAELDALRAHATRLATSPRK